MIALDALLQMLGDIVNRVGTQEPIIDSRIDCRPVLPCLEHGLCCKYIVMPDFGLLRHSGSGISLLKMVFEHGHRLCQSAGTDAEGSFNNASLTEYVV